jgi:hypothetical protein
MTFTVATPINKVKTWGGSVSASGSKEGTGELQFVYEEAANSAAQLAIAEWVTPTSGGIAIIFQPKGAASGTNKEWTFNIVVGEVQTGGEADDIEVGTAPFEMTGAITYATQS